MAAIGKDKSENTLTDNYQDGKTILPLREYRRQQRAAERKRQQAQADAQAQEEAEAEQRFKRMEEEYQSKLREWKKQCAKMQQEQARAFAQQVEREMAALKNAATQRYDQIVRENDRIISEQQKRQADAESTLAKLGVLKLAEKAQQKRVIREAKEAISSAMAAKEAAKEACDREQREAEEQVSNAEPRIRDEVAQAYPIPQKQEISKEDLRLLQEAECERFVAYLAAIKLKPCTLAEIMEQISPEIRKFSIFGPPDEPLSMAKMTTVMRQLEAMGYVVKNTEKRHTYYTVVIAPW